MLGRLLLVLVQIVVGWFASNAIMGAINVPSDFRIYVFAVVAAVVVFLIGVLAALVVKGVGSPSTGTLSFSVVLALIVAALWSFGPQLLPNDLWGRVPAIYAVLAAAIIGYQIKR